MGRVRGEQPAGGSVKLGELIDKYGAELTSDLADKGIDIRDLWREGSTLTPRYCLILAGQLNEDSAFAAANRGGPHFRSWSTSTYLLAALVNLTHAANRQRGGKATRKPLVKPPKTTKPRKITVAELLSTVKGSVGGEL